MLLASVGGLNEFGTQLYYVHAAAKDRLRPDNGPQPDIEFGGATVRDEIRGLVERSRRLASVRLRR